MAVSRPVLAALAAPVLFTLTASFATAQRALHPVASLTGQAAQPSPSTEPETLPPDEASKRNELLKPGLALLRQNDPEGAYKALWPARKAYPKDLRTLRYSAEAAFFSGDHNAEALDLFNRALALHPAQPWPLRLARLQAEARLGKWEEYDRELAELRDAKKTGQDHQLEDASGFLIDGFPAGQTPGQVQVQTIVFPLQGDRYHTLYRFLLPKTNPARTSIQAGVNSGAGENDEHCKNPDFRPYIDLESDDVDQASFRQAHPDLAGKGERSYSLDAYPSPCSQGLIKFYNEGEPKYEDVRADVLKALSGAAQK